MEGRSLKNIRASTGFEPVTSTIPVWCSTNWAVKPHIGSEVNLLSSYLPVQWTDVKDIWNSYCTAVVDESEEWSLQYITLIFFRLLLSNCLKLENLLQWSIFTLIYNRSTIWISYIFHIINIFTRLLLKFWAWYTTKNLGNSGLKFKLFQVIFELTSTFAMYCNDLSVFGG